ncbi:hypothetical protein HYT05_00690 [Candidatus Kaiserbacteria bacterium]|nr:hypothetical protein [Candidatus Kaiserbacteria bacterium]
MEYYLAIVLVMALIGLAIGAAVGAHAGLVTLFVILAIFFALTRWLKWRYAALRLMPIVPIDHMFAAILVSASIGFAAKSLFA